MNLDIGLAARVIAGIRTHTAQRTSCREWDTPGIAKALKECDGSPGDVLAAACLAAQDVKLDKPSAAGFRVCWPVNAAEPPKVSHDIPCPDHTGQVMPCPRCKAERTGPPAGFFDAVRAVLDEATRAAREEASVRSAS